MPSDMSDMNVSRRQALATAVAAAASTQYSIQAAEAEDQTPWIDAHSHIWTSDTSVYKLAPGMTPANLSPKDFTDDELMALVRPHSVGRVVLIHHQPFHGYDNAYLTDAYRRHPDLFRVVGMIDDLRPFCDRAMKQLLQEGVTGFRIGPRKGITDWLHTAGMLQMWKTAAETHQAMCCLVNPDELPAIHANCERHPETPVVIDHFARIGADGTIREADLNNLCHLARHSHVKVKISAYYALGKKQPPYDDLIPMIRRLYECFGANRLMWASDSPYLLTGVNTYKDSIDLVKHRLDFVSDEERQSLLRTTAEETFFYV